MSQKKATVLGQGRESKNMAKACDSLNPVILD
jgi:hypothetical protein